MAQDRAAEAALVTGLLNQVVSNSDRFEAGAGNKVIRAAIKATKVSGSSEEEMSTVSTLRANGMNGSQIWLSEGLMAKLCEQLYVAMAEEIGPVEADQALHAILDAVDADSAIAGSARKWF